MIFAFPEPCKDLKKEILVFNGSPVPTYGGKCTEELEINVPSISINKQRY
jgi:hypothetical protein